MKAFSLYRTILGTIKLSQDLPLGGEATPKRIASNRPVAQFELALRVAGVLYACKLLKILEEYTLRRGGDKKRSRLARRDWWNVSEISETVLNLQSLIDNG